MTDENPLDFANVMVPPIRVDTAIDHSAVDKIEIAIVIGDSANQSSAAVLPPDQDPVLTAR